MDVNLHLPVDLLAPRGQICQRKIPISVALFEHVIDAVKGFLGEKTLLAADGYEVVIDAFRL